MATSKKKAGKAASGKTAPKKSAAAKPPATKAKPPATKAKAPAPAPIAEPKQAAAPPRPVAKSAKKAVRKGSRGGMEAVPVVEVTPRKIVRKGPPPLAGVRVLDLTTFQAGGAASQALANFGAEVVKVEAPDGGDPARSLEPNLQGRGALFSLLNRGKKSLALDLDDQAGRAAVADMAKKADVLIEGFRPGRMDALGLGYKDLSTANKRLVYVSVTGYGQFGPYAGRAGQDLNFMAEGGALGLLGLDAAGAPPGVQLADYAGGALPAVIGVLLALRARESSGRGQMVDVAVLDGVMGMLAWPLATYAATRRKPQPGKDALYGQYACYNVYAVRNGRWLALGALDPRHWRNFCAAIERPDLIEDQFAQGDRQQVVIAELTRVFQKKEVREWMEHFADKEVCVSEARDIGEATHDPHLIERGVMLPTKTSDGTSYRRLGVFPLLSDNPGESIGEPPDLGADSRQVLLSYGFTKKRVAELIESGVVRQSEP